MSTKAKLKGKITTPDPTAEQVHSFIHLYSKDASIGCRVEEIYPGGNVDHHQGDALLSFDFDREAKRILLEVTACFQGPSERYGSRGLLAEKASVELKADLLQEVGQNEQVTIYVSELGRELIARPKHSRERSHFVTALRQNVARVVQTACEEASNSHIIEKGDLPFGLQPFVDGVAATITSSRGLTLRYAISMGQGSFHYTSIPLRYVGLRLTDLDQAISRKLVRLHLYRERARDLAVDGIWLLVTTDEESAAGMLGTLPYQGWNRVSVLHAQPNFDGIFLLSSRNGLATLKSPTFSGLS